jgi:LmbE family N-acetylglucosaminyl deacetylase
MVTFDAREPGTPEESWRRARVLAEIPLAPLSGQTSLIVVAAHPDDETLGCGGLIASAVARGLRVRVIVVTDGSDSHPGSTTTPAEGLRVRRADEAREAVARLAPDASIAFLGFPDGRTSDDRAEITDALRAELRTAGTGTWIAVPWSGDGHRDHRVVGEAAAVASPAEATVVGYPIWMWHWASPRSTDIPWAAARAVPLTDRERQLKQHALQAFASQIEPLSPSAGDEAVLSAEMLAHFTRDREIFFADERSPR